MRSTVRLVSPQAFLVIDSLIILSALIAAFCSADLFPLPAHLGRILATRFTPSNIVRGIAVFVVWSFLMRLLGLYKGQSIAPLSEACRIGIAVGGAAVVLGTSFGNGHMGASAPHIAADFALFCFMALFALRALATLLSASVLSTLVSRRSVLIVGSGPRAIRAYRELRTLQHRSHTVIGFVDTQATSLIPGEIDSLYLGSLGNLESILFQNVIDEVVIALPAQSCYAEIEQTIATCSCSGIEVKYPDDLFILGSGAQKARRSGHPKMVVIRPAVHDSRLLIKRFIDVAASSLAVLLLAPLFLVIAAAIKLDSPGPVFSLQERYGLSRRRFRMCKFRTLVADAESRLSAIKSLNEADGPLFKIRNDPRITNIGVFLRRLSIDELPQLFNVIVGDMALVGPRPMSVRDFSRFNEACPMRRFSVKPGITCLWQINGRTNTTFDGLMELDLQYIDNWSLGLDAQILALTIPAVLKGSGAVVNV